MHGEVECDALYGLWSYTEDICGAISTLGGISHEDFSFTIFFGGASICIYPFKGYSIYLHVCLYESKKKKTTTQKIKQTCFLAVSFVYLWNFRLFGHIIV